MGIPLKFRVMIIGLAAMVLFTGCPSNDLTGISGWWEMSFTVWGTTPVDIVPLYTVYTFQVEIFDDKGNIRARFNSDGGDVFELTGSIDDSDNDLYLEGNGMVGGYPGQMDINGSVQGDSMSGQWGIQFRVQNVDCWIDGQFTGRRTAN